MRTETQYGERYSSSQYRQYDRELTVPCAVLCAILFLILGVLYITPEGITGFYRPVFIFMTLFSIFSNYPLRSAKWQIMLAVYFVVVFVCNTITNSATVTFISHELFILFFIMASNHIWSRREIGLLLDVLILSCTLQAGIVLFSNSLLLHAGSQQAVNYLWTSYNRNPIAFAIVPGAVASLMKLIYSAKGWGNLLLRTYWGAAFLLCAYTVFALGCRSAFYSLCLGVACLIWERVGRSTTQAEKLIKRLLILACVLAGANILFALASGTYSARLFSLEETGREEIWKVALELIRKKPIFGGGYDYWTASNMTLGTHSTFLSYMLEGGVVTLVFVIGHLISYLLEIRETRSIVPLAFLAETLMHMVTESGMDYYAYLPLIFSVVITRYLQYQGGLQDLLAD